MVDSRLAFDIMARDDGATAVLAKVERALDKTGTAAQRNSKISEKAAAASANLTKAHNAESTALDRVQIAESKLSNARETAKGRTSAVQVAEAHLLQVRGDTSSKASEIAAAESRLEKARSASRTSTTQVIAGEKALSKARRESAIAGDAAQKAAKELSKVLDDEGKKSGNGLLAGFEKSAKKIPGSLKKWLTGSGGMGDAGKSGGTVFGSGFLGALKTPILGPAIVAILAGAVAVAAPAVGAVLAAGVVAGFGFGLVGLGAVFAAKSVAVKNAWNRSLWAMAADMKVISVPFERTLIDMAAFARRTFVKLTPALADSFKLLGPSMSKFGDDLGRSFEKLGPAIRPVSAAFAAVLKSLGPAMQSAMGSFSEGLRSIAASVSKNPDGLSDLVTGTGKLFKTLSEGIATLNDVNSAFKVLPGGTSAVTRTMNTLSAAVQAALFPFKELEFALNSVNALSHSLDLKPEGFAAAQQAAAQTVTNLQAVRDKAGGAGAALNGVAAAAGKSAHETHAANVAAYLLATAFDRQAAATQRSIDALNRRSNLLLSLSGAEIDYQQAIDDATQAIKDNGKTHDITTQKGRDNKRALDQVAASAIAQRDAMLKANDGNLAAGKSAVASRAGFVKLATQMGYSIPVAKAMAAQLIALPKVTRVDVQANITDLQTKLTQAETALKSPNLTATKKAQLKAEISNLKAGIAASKGLLATLPVSRTAKLLANKKDLEKKIADAQTELKNPNLTKARTAQLKADIRNAQSGIATVNGLLGNLPGSRTVTITTRLVTEKISRTVSGASGGHVPTEKRAAGGPVTAGTPYWVGEQGPEIVVPKSSGTVIPNNAINAMKTGANVVQGLAQGALGSAASAYSAAAQVAAGMISKAREVLQISSPSKAFAKLGLYVTQGFAIGLRGSAKQVQSVMASLMSKVLDIAFNAADTKKAAQKNIAAYSAAIAAARKKIKPITSGMSKAEADKVRRNNTAAAQSIKALQAKLASAKVDLANVNAIASRLGTTKKRNAVIGMIQRENVAMQKLANARAVVANNLKAAQARLASAVQIRDEFKKSITDAALAFNSITNIQSEDSGRTLVASDIISRMQQTLAKTKAFAQQLANLKSLGLRGDLYKQIAESGVEAGGATAAAILQGGKGAVASVNNLQSQISTASVGLGTTAAKNMYQAGVDAAQGLVNGLLAKTKALDAASKKLAAAIVAQIKKTLGIKSPSKVMEWHGSMVGQGFSAGILGEVGRVEKAGVGLSRAAIHSPVARRGGVSGSASSGGEVRVVLEFKTDGSPHMEQLARDFRKYVRATAGGNVQLALGS